MQTSLRTQERSNNSSSMDDEVEILEPDSASKTIFASRNSNPRRWEREALGEGHSSGRKSLNPYQGTDLICTCNENEVTAYLRSAVERKDFGFVFRTLRGRELRFRTSEKIMEEEVDTLKRELVAAREAEEKKFSKLMEQYEGLKFKHRETESQLEGLEIKNRETESQLDGLKIKQRETESQLEGLKIKNRETESQLEVLKIKNRETESQLESLKIKHRGTGSELEGLKKRFDNLSKDYREKISEGLNHGSLKEKKSSEMEIVPGCETPARGQADTGVSTPLMEVSTPKCLEKSVVKDKECSRMKRILKFDSEDDIETQGREGDRIADVSNFPVHASSLPLSSVNNVVNKVLSAHCSVNIVSNGLSLGVLEVDGLGNIGIEENSLHRQSDPMAIMKSEDEIITSANLGASCHSSEEKSPRDGLRSSIPARKIDMEGSVVGTSLQNEVVILSDSDSESSRPSLRKNILSPCSKKATCTPKKQNIEEDIQSGVKIGGVSDDGGNYSDQNEGQPLQRGAKRRCQMTVSSGSESNSSDVGFSCKRRKPRSGNSQTQGICEAECIKDTGASAGENVQCETSPKGPKEDAVLSDPHETYECRVLDRNNGKEDSLSCKEVEDVPDMKLKRIRKTKDVNELLTVELCVHTDESQGKASTGGRFRSLKRVIEGNELPDIGQLDEGISQGKRSPVTKYRRLKRGEGEAVGPEKSNVGNVPEKNTLDLDINDDTISNDNGECKFSMGGSSFAKRGKSDRPTKVAEGPSDSSIYTQNNRRLRSQSRKMINLTKESDGEDEDEDVSDSEIDDLGDFIVDSSESEKDSERADGNKSDSENSTNDLDSEAESNPSSGDDLHEVIRKLSRQTERKLDWKYEGEMLAAFAKDDVLCMRAVCALYRQQTNDERRGKSSLYLNRRGFDKFHATRGSLLAEFLTGNDSSGPMNKSLQELHEYDSKGAEYCKKLAIHHSKQLFEIYRNNEDPHFPHR